MKRYIISLSLFISLYICAMYLAQKYTDIKPAGRIPARLSYTLLTPKDDEGNGQNSQKAEAAKAEAAKKQAELELQEKQKQILEAQARAKAEAARLAQEKRDKNFNDKGLVNIETLSVKLFLDIRYATPNNFTGKKLYSSDKCYLQKDTAEALGKAALYASQEETPFYLCIYDCYRPLSAQKEMWDIHPVPGEVANPKEGSNHNRGTAVDLGPCDDKGFPLETPTDFDDFSEQAYAYAQEGISPQAIKNRAALQKVMRKAGFTTIKKEWWHFNYKNAQAYPLVDLEF